MKIQFNSQLWVSCSQLISAAQPQVQYMLRILFNMLLVILGNRWHVNKNYTTKSTTKQTGYRESNAGTLYQNGGWVER